MTRDVLEEAVRLGIAGTPAALVTVIRVSGSTPRHPGAKMVVPAEGDVIGSIGGGRIELEVSAAAQAVARGTAPAQRIRRHLTHALAMCCGGEMECWLEPLDGARWKPLDEAARRRAKRVPSALVTALDGSGKDLLRDDPCLTTRAPRLDAAAGDSGADRFIEPILPPDRLVIFGAGHVAHATAPLAARVGFQVIVCDEDERYATAERFPDATQLVHDFDPGPAIHAFGPGDWVLILTRDHAVDQAILERLLPRPELAYLGLIGSRGKLGRFKKRLEARGIGDEAAWARLHSPVGLDIGAETPEEIAVAIVAELVQCARRR